MDPTVTNGLIIAGGTIVGAILGAIATRFDVVDAVFGRNQFTNLVGKWKSTWQEIGGHKLPPGRELLIIERQKGARVWGYIEMESEPDKRWDFDGKFNGRFLQLMYYPSKKSHNDKFLDYGCYFFEQQGAGDFVGYSIGFSWDLNRTYPSTHQLKRVR